MTTEENISLAKLFSICLENNMMLKTLLIKLGPAIDASGDNCGKEEEVPVEEFELGICPSQEVNENGGGSEKEVEETDALEEEITIK